ncbi:MAG: ABC transporter ATP-binding protein/permease [Defluviitaleaceae bacterium]|nr:ABC transporter ATP-binding protein/permease [Defluviitaleaceae bacterium]MCL2275964.1 ABC transporter ATP-binding protein/permease [Defluviitaleaceae bacterium]
MKGNRFQRERERPKHLTKTILRLLGYFREQWYALPAIFLLSIGATAAALIGPFLIGRLIDGLVYPFPAATVTRFALPIFGLLLVLYIWDSLAQFLQTWVVAGASQRLVRSMRHYLFAHLQRLPIKFFDKYMHGELMSRLSNDTDNIAGILGMALVQLTSIFITVTGVLAMMLWLSPQMTFFALVSVPFFFVVGKTIGAKTRRYFRDQQLELGLLNAKIEEDISGIAVIKAYGCEKKSVQDFAKINERLRKAGTQAQIWSGFIMPAMNVINNLSLTVVAFAGAVLAINGSITVGVIASFIAYARQFGRPLNDLASTYNQLQSALASTERVFEILDVAEETPDPPNAVELTQARGDIAFKNVHFGYTEDTPIITDFNFSAAGGSVIALVGPTGAGKTTLVNLVTRFYDINAGEIVLDGQPLENYTRNSLRRAFGIVLQDTYLFTGSIMENLRYGKPNATDEEVKKAAKLVGADRFIRQLPEGYATLLAENSRNLSGGQRQLLAITRCVLANPDILILDEATSSVDTRTEAKIQQAMNMLMQGRTSFVIAHRLRTVADADNILVIDGGKIVEQGNHQALMAQQGVYKRMFDMQLKGIMT